MNITWSIALLGAFVTALGWLVPHALSTSAENRRQRLMARMEFTKQQLEELYGPLLFLILEGQQTVQDMFAILGWTQVFEHGSTLSEKELSTWLFYAEYDYFPRNKKIIELLSSKTHLIEGEKIPESFLAFLDHYNSWYINHLRWQKHGIEYGWRSKIPWPPHFNEDVLLTFRALKKRHSILIDMISESFSLRQIFQKKHHQKVF